MERRRWVRKFTASGIELFSLERELLCEVNVNDISQGGVLVVSYGPESFDAFKPGERLRFKMKIPTGEIAGIAEVVWKKQDDGRMGLKFTIIENEGGISNLMAFVSNEFI